MKKQYSLTFKIILVGVCFSVPIAALATFLVSEKDKVRDFALKEQTGVSTIADAMDVLVALVELSVDAELARSAESKAELKKHEGLARL